MLSSCLSYLTLCIALVRFISPSSILWDFDMGSREAIYNWTGTSTIRFRRESDGCPVPEEDWGIILNDCWSICGAHDYMYRSSSTVGYNDIKLKFSLDPWAMSYGTHCDVLWSTDISTGYDDWNLLFQTSTGADHILDQIEDLGTEAADIENVNIIFYVNADSDGSCCYVSHVFLNGTEVTPSPTESTSPPTSQPTPSPHFIWTPIADSCADLNSEFVYVSSNDKQYWYQQFDSFIDECDSADIYGVQIQFRPSTAIDASSSSVTYKLIGVFSIYANHQDIQSAINVEQYKNYLAFGSGADKTAGVEFDANTQEISAFTGFGDAFHFDKNDVICHEDMDKQQQTHDCLLFFKIEITDGDADIVGCSDASSLFTFAWDSDMNTMINLDLDGNHFDISFNVLYEDCVQIFNTFDSTECDDEQYIMNMMVDISTTADLPDSIDILKSSCLNAFENTVDVIMMTDRGEWPTGYCFDLSMDGLTVDEDQITAGFQFSEELHDDVFANDNVTMFQMQFSRMLGIELQRNGLIDDIGDVSVNDVDGIQEYDTASDHSSLFNFDNDVLIIIISIILFALFLDIFGYIHSSCRGADNFKYFSVALFGVYMADFFSDLFFALDVWTLYASPTETNKTKPYYMAYFIVFVLSLTFIAFPLLKNFIDLNKFQSNWQNHALHADRYRSWLDQYGTILFVLSFICGSTFGALELVNSNLLGHRIFCMGLSKKDLREFNQRRLFNVIVGENVPQLILQILFVNMTTSTPNTITLLAMISSSLSICLAVLDWNSKRKILSDTNVQETLFSVKVSCAQKPFQNISVYKHKTWYLAVEIAKIFALDRNAVEILPMTKYSDHHSDGLMVYFFITTSKRKPADLYRDLDTAMKIEENGECHLARQIAKAWQLKYGEGVDQNDQIKLKELNLISSQNVEIDDVAGETRRTSQKIQLEAVHSTSRVTSLDVDEIILEEEVAEDEGEGGGVDGDVDLVHEGATTSSPGAMDENDAENRKEHEDSNEDVDEEVLNSIQTLE